MPPLIASGVLLLVFTSISLNWSGEPLIRIMPLGDSITQGPADSDSYRRPLWKLLKKNNPRIDFVGSLKTNYPYTRSAHSDFDVDHEGHWGWRAGEVLAKIGGWAEQATPDIVLVHLGTNDIQKQKNEDTVEELRQIIIALRKQNPRIKIFLAQLIPIAGKTANMRIREFNALLHDMARSITTGNSPVHIVNQYEGFDAFKDTYDGVHPNESGIEKMAQKWHKALMTISELEM